MSKKVFFSDLDRTLIFSNKFLQKGLTPVLVETKGEKAISYMTKEAFSLLEQVRKESIFIPVSTRTYETMTRIGFIQDNMPEWMICDNGAHIYHNGERVQEWERHIQSKRNELKTTVKELEKTIQHIFEDRGLKATFNIEDLYLMVKFEEMTWEIRQSLEILNISLRKKGYRIDVNSRKAYLLPEYIRKEDAVRYLINSQGWGFTISAGDSLMDKDMLKETSYAIAPKHKSFPDDFMHVTERKGMKAGEETLHYVQHLLRYRKK